jgi:hypothetical protein
MSVMSMFLVGAVLGGRGALVALLFRDARRAGTKGKRARREIRRSAGVLPCARASVEAAGARREKVEAGFSREARSRRV